MGGDLISIIRKQQLELADKLAAVLFGEVKPYLDNGKYQGLESYVHGDFIETMENSPQALDTAALSALVLSSIQGDVSNTVLAYTDWLATRIVRQGDYTLPVLEESDAEEMLQEFGIVPGMVLLRTILYMHSQPELPLLGKIEEGKFNPVPPVFEQWKSLYDWDTA